MLETISKGFSQAKNLLLKQTTLSEENIAESLNQVRLSLLDADVEYGVVKSFLARVKERALGLTLKTSVSDKKGKTHKLSPAEHFIRICHEELEALMGPESGELELNKPLNSFMMVGLQGSGKTTSSAKLARYLKEDRKKKPILIAADIYRPGAAEQLKILAERLDVAFFHQENATAQEICQNGLKKALELKCNAIIYDTAGRLAIDEELMNELSDIKSLVRPDHIYMVIDAMIGQDAVNTAKSFDQKLSVDGFILTKLDGDARGGAALSIKEVTKKTIKFLGMGEDLKSLEPFRPEGLASRILGMGDVVSLAKDFEKHVDEKEAEADAKRILRGSFTFDDFIKQLNLMKKIGSFQSIMERIPGMSELTGGAKVDDREFIKFEAMISSMTKDERKMPELLVKNASRRNRVAKGSGRKVSELDQLLERFMMMRKMMAMVGKNPQGLKMPSLKPGGAFGAMPSLGGVGGNPFSPSITEKPKVSMKQKKDKRKQQKLARKKSKSKK
jgi:signal recognition particle subunit SRP54